MLDILLIFGIPYCINLLICQFGVDSPLQQLSHAYVLSFEKGTGSRKTGFLSFHLCIHRDLDSQLDQSNHAPGCWKKEPR